MELDCSLPCLQEPDFVLYPKKNLNAVACSPQANYTDRAAAAC
jgi:hypothetical protein